MNETFGKFIEEKRKEKGISLRGLAGELNITPGFLSDIEKGHRYPPQKDKLYELVQILQLSEDQTNEMFDMAARGRDYAVSPDLSEYIMDTKNLRAAIRLARDNGLSEAAWQKVIDLLKQEKKAGA